METYKDYGRFKASCEEFRGVFSDTYFSTGSMFCHPLLDGVIYVPCSQEESRKNTPDICRMSDMLLMSADGEEFVPFKIADARQIAAENGQVFLANLLNQDVFIALDWMIDGKHDTVIVNVEHMRKNNMPYAPVTPLTNVIQPFKKITNNFLYKKGTLEEPAVLSDKDISERLDAYLDDMLTEVVSPEIAGETEFDIFGMKITCDKNESRCKEVDKAASLAERLEKEMAPNMETFRDAGIDIDMSGYMAKLFVKAAAKCGVKAEEKDFTGGDPKALADKFRAVVSEKNGYGFKYAAPDKDKAEKAIKAVEVSTAAADELKKNIAELLTVRPVFPAVFNLARAASPADAEAVENIAMYWGSEALTPDKLGEYLSGSFIPADCRDSEGKLCCGGAKAMVITEDIKKAAEKYKLKNFPVIEELEKYSEDAEKESRTYNGTVFDTVADMEKAVKNEAELAEKCSDLSALNENELKQLRKYIYDMKLDNKTTGKYLLKIKLALNNCEDSQLKLLCTGLTLKKPEELSALAKKISEGGFDEVVAAPYIAKIKDAEATAQLAELSEMFKAIPDAAKAEQLEKALESGKYDKMFKRHFKSKIDDARDGFAKNELAAICKDIPTADNKTLDEIAAKLAAVKCRDSLKAPYKRDIDARKTVILEKEVDAAFAGIKDADKAKLESLSGIIASGKYPAALTDKYKAQISTRMTELENAEFIKRCETIMQMNKAELDKITEELNGDKYPREICEKYLPRTKERAEAIIKAELSEMCKDISAMDFAKLDELEKKLSDEKYAPELTASYKDAVKARRKSLYNAEADKLCKDIATMFKPALAELSEKLKDEKFDPEYTKKYFEQIDVRFNKIETDKLDSMCKNIENMKKPELEKLSADIANLGFKKENTDPYLEKIRKCEINLMKAEMESLCKNIGTTPRKELSKLREALESGEFDKELSAKYIDQIDKRTEELIKQELADLCKNIANSPKDKLMEMKIAINETPEYKEAGKAYAEQIESRLKQLDKAEFDKQMSSIEKLNSEELDKFVEELEKRKPALDPKLYEASVTKCRERREELERFELDDLCENVAKADIAELHSIKEKISEGGFTPAVTFPYLKKVDDAINNYHVQYYTKITENITKMSRADLIVLLEKINKNENGAPDDMRERYVGRVNAKIREADAKMLDEKCRNLGSASEHRCMALIRDINEMDIDPDTKKRFINQVELKITNLKTIERDKYVGQLTLLMKEKNVREAYFYIPGVSKSFENTFLKVQQTYASLEQFEMPVLIHEVTAGVPDESFLLTTRYLYSKSKSGLNRVPVEQIERFEGKGGLFGSSLRVVEKNGKPVELPANIDKKLYENTATVINGVIALIQKDKADASLREAEERKAAEEAKAQELETERKEIEAARVRAAEADKQAEKAEAAAKEAEKAEAEVKAAEEKKIEPLKPIKPIEVVVSPIPDVKPIKPIDGAEPAKSAEPVKPAEPVKSAEPAKPVVAVKPVEAPKAAEVKPIPPVQPIKPIEAPKTAAPVQQAQPAQPAKPATPVQPAKPATPVQPVKPATPVQPAKPATPVQPAKPADAAKPKLKFCDQCGAKITSDSAKFCAECGNRLIL